MSASHVSPLKRVFELVRLERHDIGVIVIYGAIVAVLSLATPLAVSSMVSAIAFSNLMQPLLVLAILLAIALLAGGVLRALQLAVVEVLQRRVFVRLVADLAWRLPRLAGHEREARDTGKLVNRFFDIVTVQKVLPTLLIDGATLVLELAIGLIVLALYSPFLMAFAVILFVGIIVIVFVLGIGGIRSSIDESYAKHDVAGWLEELARHPTLFHAAGPRRLGLLRADHEASRYLEARRRHFRVLLRQAIGGFVLQAIAATALLGVGGILVIDGTLTLGQLVASELIVGAITYNLVKLHKQLESGFDLIAAVDKLGTVVELDVERDEQGGAPAISGPITVVARDVSIDEVTGVNLELGAGEKLALLNADGGVSGSAFVDVLLGYRRAKGGRVLVNDLDVPLWSLPALRERVQRAGAPEIIEGTLEDNLRVGRDGIDTAAIVDALRFVELDDEFLSNPDGLQTRLVASSRRLDASTAWRLMIARALLGNPGLIILDGSLDVPAIPLTHRIIDRLLRLPQTVIVVTADPNFAGRFPRQLSLGLASEPTPPGTPSGSPTVTPTTMPAIETTPPPPPSTGKRKKKGGR
jgi:ABC-type bacteriocin/lantibiotic exporter with double-glycine peptidase domain